MHPSSMESVTSSTATKLPNCLVRCSSATAITTGRLRPRFPRVSLGEFHEDILESGGEFLQFQRGIQTEIARAAAMRDRAGPIASTAM
jgi:hypothetical protein